MTEPLPPIAPQPGFPPWYQGGFVDTERLLIDYFGGLLDNVECLSWFPPEKVVLEQIQEPTNKIYLRIFRSGGRIIRQQSSQTESKGSVDQAHVQFAAMSASRDLSWEVIEFVRQVMYCYLEGGGRIDTATLYAVIRCNGEIVGPVLTPESFRDQRLVPVTFELEVQRRKGLPSFAKYGAELGL